MTGSFSLLAVPLLIAASVAHAATVPSIGCATDGQVGPEPAPANGTRVVAIDARAAAGLAWYFQSEMGVLAPRGWQCMALAGSGGISLYVTPRQNSAQQMLTGKFSGIEGPTVQISVDMGGTSGRFAAARRIARLFPQERKFVDAVIAEGFGPAADFPFGPYPHDQLTRRGDRVVEYLTPAGTSGLGYDSWLTPGEGPVAGVVILLNDDHDVLKLAIRLPQNLRAAAPAIIQQVESDHPPENPQSVAVRTPPSGLAGQIQTGDAAVRQFVYQGRAVHPFCLDFPADSAHTNPVPLSRCSDNKLAPEKHEGGWLGVDYPRDADGSFAGYIWYKVLARKGDRYLVGTTHSGGGSGEFANLLWVRLGAEQIVVAKDLQGGDRCVASPGNYQATGAAIDFDVSTPAALIIELSGVPIDKFILRQLAESPPDCDGNARYHYDLVTETLQLLSLKLEVPHHNGNPASVPQACFDRLVQARNGNGKMLLDAAALKELGLAFARACAASLPR